MLEHLCDCQTGVVAQRTSAENVIERDMQVVDAFIDQLVYQGADIDYTITTVLTFFRGDTVTQHEWFLGMGRDNPFGFTYYGAYEPYAVLL